MLSLTNFNQIVQIFNIKPLGLNWIDCLIILIVFIYGFEGYALGFIRAFLDFLAFVASFILGLFFYGFWAGILITHFNIPHGFSNAIGFFIMAFITEVALSLLFRFLYSHLYFIADLNRRLKETKYFDQVLGIIPGILSAFVLISFVLTLIVALPLSSFLKNSVAQSRFGHVLVENTQGFAGDLNIVFGGAVKDALTFLTVEPKSQEVLDLNFKTSDIRIDPNAETEMFDSVNFERKSSGLSPLFSNSALQKVARAHCEDMFKRGYFSHYTPEGLSPFDRMANADISYTYAGENLALAPNVTLAMQGLMQSPGHRANILSKNYGKVGIGAIDGGVYGQMFCQEFTD